MSLDNFADIDAILAAGMEDLDDLPPVGVPPTGHYNLTVSFEIRQVGDDKRDLITAQYTVDAVNELKNPEEADEVQAGQAFSESFFLVKKDGTKNVYGIGTLKQRLAVFAERLGTTNIGQLIEGVKQLQIAASVKRKVNPRNEDNYNVQFKDVILL